MAKNEAGKQQSQQQQSSSPSPSPRPQSNSNAHRYKEPNLNQKLLHRVFNVNLPTPRILTPTDTLFQTREMKAGLRQRKADERELQTIQTKLISCAKANDRKCIEEKMQDVNQLLYGKGVTMQEREEFLVKYGCTPYSDEILDKILDLSFTLTNTKGNHDNDTNDNNDNGNDKLSHRGIMDIGAGNGQWARALSDRAKVRFQGQRQTPVDIVAYDDGSAIPLNTNIYHDLTQPSREYFYNIKTMDGAEAVRLIKNRGRVLLLIYPPPGPMALDVVKNYAKFLENDIVVFVGEGLGGANGNQELFDYFKNTTTASGARSDEDDGTMNNINQGNEYKWILLESMNVPNVKGGGKGFEKLYIFKRVKFDSSR